MYTYSAFNGYVILFLAMIGIFDNNIIGEICVSKNNCLTFDLSTGICTKCVDGYFNVIVDFTPSELFDNTQSTWVYSNADASCQTCNQIQQCTEWVDGYYLIGSTCTSCTPNYQNPQIQLLLVIKVFLIAVLDIFKVVDVVKLGVVHQIQAIQHHVLNMLTSTSSQIQDYVCMHIYPLNTFDYRTNPTDVSIQTVQTTTPQSRSQYFFKGAISIFALLDPRYTTATYASRYFWTNQSCMPCISINSGSCTSCTNLTTCAQNTYITGNFLVTINNSQLCAPMPSGCNELTYATNLLACQKYLYCKFWLLNQQSKSFLFQLGLLIQNIQSFNYQCQKLHFIQLILFIMLNRILVLQQLLIIHAPSFQADNAGGCTQQTTTNPTTSTYSLIAYSQGNSGNTQCQIIIHHIKKNLILYQKQLVQLAHQIAVNVQVKRSQSSIHDFYPLSVQKIKVRFSNLWFLCYQHQPLITNKC